MNIQGVTSVPAGNQTSTTPPTSKNTLGKDDFMKLLVTQLSTQDPLSPMDSKDFGAQLAQFSSLEQMTNVNTNLVALQQMQGVASAASAVTLIGKKVDAQGNGVQLKSGAPQSLGYSLAQDASSVAVDVFDAAGNKVTTLKGGNQSAGVNSMQWLGKDASGNTLPDGAYTFTVTASAANGAAVAATTYSTGLVTDVVFENGVTKAIVNGNKVLLSQISRVS
jgi:flagellar basal-body rod modification protein FlgD